MWSILFRVLGRETTFSLVEVLQQPIRYFHLKVLRANMRNKMDHIMWKSMKNCAQKWCRSLCAFLFEATCAFGKMWQLWIVFETLISYFCDQKNESRLLSDSRWELLCQQWTQLSNLPNSVSNGFCPIMILRSSRRFQRYPTSYPRLWATTYMWVSSRLFLHCGLRLIWAYPSHQQRNT